MEFGVRMKHRGRLAMIAIMTAMAFSGSAAGRKATAQGQAHGPVSASSSQRAGALLKQMTIEEKLGQLNQIFLFQEAKDEEPSKEAGQNIVAAAPSAQKLGEGIRKGEYGSFLFVTDPAYINKLQRIAVNESRLKIPLIFGFDVIHGFRTIFPVPIGMAASWDPELVERSHSIAAREAYSVGIRWAFAPMLDIARDPRWGRMVEGPGEDPYLGAALAAAQVRGFQGPSIGTAERIVACMKHFAGYGAAEGGRDYEASQIPESMMWNVYLAPFEAAVKAGIGSAMSAYMDLNDVPATGNSWLLTDVLRKTWGFKGFVVSDANAVRSLINHGFAGDPEDAAVRALKAGVNMEMAIGSTYFSENLQNALKKGRITQRQIDEAVLPILEIKYQLGLFDNPYADESRVDKVLGDPGHRAAARTAAERSAVLLKNEGGLLPLRKDAYRKIAVVGPLADSKRDSLGSWAFKHDLDETVTEYAGIKAKVGASAQVETAQGSQLIRKFPSFFDQIEGKKPEEPWSESQAKEQLNKAIELARQSDLTVLVLGEEQDQSGEAASRSSLELPGNQQALMEAVAALGKPVVLVLMSGRPLDISWAAAHVPAILEIWYPGTQGGTAVANLLFGDAVPGGKLPFSWPRNVGHIPMFYAQGLSQDVENKGKRYWNEESTPLYPFGYGLSYAAFSFSNLEIAKPVARAGEIIQVSADVQNTANTAGDEVVQLYVHQRYGSSSRPIRELKGFQRVALKPGEKKTVRFTLGPDELKYWSTSQRRWIVEPSDFDVWVGSDSGAKLHGEFKVVDGKSQTK
ncbi:MAG: glycosyl hydrolase family, 3 [Acidobacteria bacterium]|nr:glycosyl hydrolase family, 3 [Acidobacteriota bacterium]